MHVYRALSLPLAQDLLLHGIKVIISQIKNDRDFGRFCLGYSALKIERSEHQADNLAKLRIESLSVYEPIAKIFRAIEK